MSIELLAITLKVYPPAVNSTSIFDDPSQWTSFYNAFKSFSLDYCILLDDEKFSALAQGIKNGTANVVSDDSFNRKDTMWIF